MIAVMDLFVRAVVFVVILFLCFLLFFFGNKWLMVNGWLNIENKFEPIKKAKTTKLKMLLAQFD